MSRLRQLVLCARDIDSATNKICEELDTYVTFRDPSLKGFGLQNVLLPVGGSFLEIVSPITKNVTADRYLNKYGDGGYMMLIQLNDAKEFNKVANKVKNNNIRVIHRGGRSFDMKDKVLGANKDKYGVTEPGIAGIHLHPHDVGCITEVTNMIPSDQWLWAGTKWDTYNERLKVQKSRIVGFGGVTIAVDDPAEKCKVWRELLGFESDTDGQNDNVVVLRDMSMIKFVKKKNEKENGVIGIDVYCKDAKYRYSKEICGVLFTFIPFRTSKL